jgi:hypothetical protein
VVCDVDRIYYLVGFYSKSNRLSISIFTVIVIDIVQNPMVSASMYSTVLRISPTLPKWVLTAFLELPSQIEGKNTVGSGTLSLGFARPRSA